ncbi:uncharacterized protein LOC120129676 [Hibiscus syriacus]|uniref:uncharacterized protein LOC120129676 n=1 Tax=Hibiscus syriacus TaxID=106335 RepID=UPI001921C4A1|nr:uncharacterized protein LOC120129676 [Hibiscus syriacus]
MSAKPLASSSSAVTPSIQGGPFGSKTLSSCEHCGRCHFGECKKKLGTCFRCGYGDYFLRDYPEPAPIVQTPARTPARTQISYSTLFDNGSTHFYVSYSIFEGFNIPVENTENSVIVQSIHGKIFLADLMELPLEEFDLILGMYWLNKHRVNLDCETKRDFLKTPDNQRIVMIEEYCGFLTIVVSAFLAERIIRKGFEASLAYILYTRSSRSDIEGIQIVKEFLDVFPEELSGLPSNREVEFEIEVYSGSTPVSMASYRMGPNKLKKLKFQLQVLLDRGFIRPSASP